MQTKGICKELVEENILLKHSIFYLFIPIKRNKCSTE